MRWNITSKKRFVTEPLFVSAVRRDYLDIEDIYLVRSIEQLKSQAEQRKILSETVREYGKWYDVNYPPINGVGFPSRG